ncbi:amidohydrolase [Clostridiales bacterium oral taxon 876 str. F0540]|nr:amidohydrolase [Clostridiales bacterium oral taxon 876 str. F0540]
MKQEMLSYLYTIKDDIFNLSKYLYENPEESFYEYKAYDYIVKMLKDNNFKVTENYLDIPTAFHAEFGSGHPKICFICEYDAATKEGHVTGHNLISAMSTAAALSLSKVLKNFDAGTIVLLGCPGEFVSGAKVTMTKQGTFNDIDVVLMAHPDVENAETGTSMALLPVQIRFTSETPMVNSSDGSYSSLDACYFIVNSLSFLKNGFSRSCNIDNVKITNGEACNLVPSQSDLKFYIRAPKMTAACEIENKIKELTNTAASIMNLKYEITMPELPYDELIPNHALSRIFAHNLKEIGIIDTVVPKNSYSGLSLGTVSHAVPCIHPYVSVVDDCSIKYNSIDFARATVSKYAEDKVLKISSALAMTALDLLEKEDLLQEVKVEFYENIKNHQETPCEVL